MKEYKEKVGRAELQGRIHGGLLQVLRPCQHVPVRGLWAEVAVSPGKTLQLSALGGGHMWSLGRTTPGRVCGRPSKNSSPGGGGGRRIC